MSSRTNGSPIRHDDAFSRIGPTGLMISYHRTRYPGI